MDTKHNILNGLGYTLIELVVVLAVTAILMSVVSAYITLPIRSYVNTVRRAELVDAAEMALRRLERDIRRALPNSLRVRTNGNLKALELVHSISAFRYRKNPPGNVLSFNVGGDSSFDVLEEIDSELLGTFNYRLSINNRGELGANLYNNADVITPETTSITFSNVSNEGLISLSAPFQFTSESPRQRVYVIDEPVTYLCNQGNSGMDANAIRRYSGYSIQATQPIDPASAPLASAKSALLSRYITSCDFEYTASNPSERNAIINIVFTITDAGEQIRLMHQVAVGNAP